MAYKNMGNQAMQSKLNTGECLDVREIGEQQSNGDFLLHEYHDNVDYCDAEKEEWIWSIGKHKLSGKIYASKTGKFYQNPDYECLWLR